MSQMSLVTHAGEMSRIVFRIAITGLAIAIGGTSVRTTQAAGVDRHIEHYALFGYSDLHFKGSDADTTRGFIHGGNIGVNRAALATTDTLLDISGGGGAHRTILDDFTQTVCDTARIGDAASLWDLYMNTTQFSLDPGVVRHQGPTSFTAPLLSSLPPFPSFTPGNNDLVVSQSQSLILPPGTYGDLLVKDDGILTLTAGLYVFGNFECGKNVSIFNDPNTVCYIGGDFTFNNDGYCGPSALAQFFVRSDNVGANNVTVGYSRRTEFHGQVLAPNGRIDLGNHTDLYGRFWADEINSDFNANVTMVPFLDCNNNGFPDMIDLQDPSFDCDNNGQIDSCEIADAPTLDCNNDGVLDACEEGYTDCNGNSIADSCDLLTTPALDCNNNGVFDACEPGYTDCNGNGVADFCDLAANPSLDCNNNGLIDSCEQNYTDCNNDGIADFCELAENDCNNNGIADFCELGGNDCNNNGQLDVCEPGYSDCNNNGVADFCDIATTPTLDCNNNGTIDTCERDYADCNNNGVLDTCEPGYSDCNENIVADFCDIATTPSLDCNNNGIIDTCEDGYSDCNNNGVADFCDIATNPSLDCNNNGIIDTCDVGYSDCNNDGVADFCELAGNDCNHNGVPDDCELPGNDCNNNGQLDVCDLATTPSLDCDNDNVIDSCELAGRDCNNNGVLDSCELAGHDCNNNGQLDVCDLATTPSLDCDHNNVIDSCELAGRDCDNNGTLDSCELAGHDCNNNGVLDSCDIANHTATDCNNNETPDSCELAGHDCNNNGVLDSCEIAGHDCNNNGVLDSCELAGQDCNNNGVIDSCDIANQTSTDMNNNGVPDSCEGADLSIVKSAQPNPATVGQAVTYTIVTTNNGPNTAINVSAVDTLPPNVAFDSATAGCVEVLGTVTCALGNINAGTSVSVEIIVTPTSAATLHNQAVTTSTFPLDPIIANNQSSIVVTFVITDCNNNGVDDATDIANMTSADCNNNGIPDECDIATTPSLDCNNDGAIDSCELATGPVQRGGQVLVTDCNNNGVIDSCELAGNDCNNNGILDSCDIAADPSLDCDNNGVIDSCELVGHDCNNNGVLDRCEIATTPTLDCNQNGELDQCEIATTPSLDCNHDGLIDSCQPPCVSFCDDTFTSGVAPFNPAIWLPLGNQTDGFAITTYDPDAGAYKATIFTNANFRSTGIFDNSSDCIPYEAVGSANYVKGKFFIYHGGQSTAAQNEIPTLRMRVANRFGVNSMLEVQSHVDDDPAATAIAADVVPSTSPTSPSLYRVDFDPVDVPALSNPGDSGKLLRGFESFAISPQDNGYLALTEITICVYPAASLPPDQATDQLLTTGTTDAGSLAVRNMATDVMLQSYTTTGVADISVPRPTYAEGPEGVTLDSTNVPAAYLGIATREFNPGAETALEDHLRAEPCKIYKVRFHITSTQQSNLNAHLQVRARTIRFNWTQKFEIGGAFAAGDLTNQIAQEALPGVGCLNPDKEGSENGGWYTLLMNTPLSEDIRPEFPDGTPLAVRMPLLSAQPGPGVPLPSLLDIRLGMDIVDTFDHDFRAPLEKGNMTIDRIEVRSYPLISD